VNWCYGMATPRIQRIHNLSIQTGALALLGSRPWALLLMFAGRASAFAPRWVVPWGFPGSTLGMYERYTPWCMKITDVMMHLVGPQFDDGPGTQPVSAFMAHDWHHEV